MRKLLPSVLAAFAALSLAGPAAAEEVSVTVSYADLDLTTAAGSAALDARIEAAVKDVCPKPDVRDLSARTAWRECVTTARAGAKEQLSLLEPYETLALTSLF